MKFVVFITVTLLFYSTSAYAYVGPGLGLGAIAAIAGVLISIVMAIVGVFWYPIKRLLNKNKDEESSLEDEDEGETIDKALVDESNDKDSVK